MRLWSDSWINGERIPQRYAAGKPSADGGVGFSDNLNPHLAWADVPAGTRSFALICHDFDVPSQGFTGAQMRQAIDEHVLAEAMHSGTYMLNRRLMHD